MLLLKNCAACARTLGQDSKRCGNCKTPFCNAVCQKVAWRRGGHKAVCGTIADGGGAEQYHAGKKYEEAVAVAVAACAEDTKGQTCFICMEGVKRRTGEGLVSGFCACRGTSGYAHVSCLSEEVQTLVREACDNNRDDVFSARWNLWQACGLCKQEYDGFVMGALGWACWKTYVPQSTQDLWARCKALGTLGNGLRRCGQSHEALVVFEARLTCLQQLYPGDDEQLLPTLGNIAICYKDIGRLEEALAMERDMYTTRVGLHGAADSCTLIAALSLLSSLNSSNNLEEAVSFAPSRIADCRRVLGDEHEVTIRFRGFYAYALAHAPGAPLDELAEAKVILEDVCSISSRVWGATHRRTLEHQGVLWGVFRLFFHSLLMKVFSRQKKLLRAGQLEMKTRAFAVWRWKANRRRQLAEESRLLVEMMKQFEV